jgi:uncharacterized metal-binding protein
LGETFMMMIPRGNRSMHPLLGTFVRLTLIVAALLVALVVAAFLFKLVLVAAVLAALAVGALFLYNLLRGRSRLLTRR